jgi:hypothetical protein
MKFRFFNNWKMWSWKRQDLVVLGFCNDSYKTTFVFLNLNFIWEKDGVMTK